MGSFLLALLAAALSRPEDAERCFDAPWVAVPLLTTFTCAAGALMAGVAAAGFRRERSLLVLAAIAVGCIVTAFGVGELVFPH